MPLIPTPVWPDTDDSAAPPVGNVTGVRTPVVWLNKKILFSRNIKSIHLDFCGRYPEGTLTVIDSTESIAETDPPSANNRILIAISPATDDAYKKIKIPGYITDVFKVGPGTTTYSFIYKYMPLEIPQMEAYPCSNTYNFFKRVAQATKLGFAISNNVKDIDDLHYRVFGGKNLKQAMDEQIQFAGLDENSIFDYWVDPWGYINLVNIPYQVQEVDLNVDLKIEVGHSSDVQDIPSSIETQQIPSETGPVAFITNLQLNWETNIHIAYYRRITDNNRTVFRGNSVQYQQFTMEGAGTSESRMEQLDVITSAPQVESIDASQYEFAKYRFQGFEMDDVPILKQKSLHENYMTKYQTNYLEVVMSKPNFGLTRGGQIQVIIYSYGQRYMKMAEMSPDEMLDEREQMPTIDPTMTGVYYIHGMTFDFVNGEKYLKQTLKLIPIIPQFTAPDFLPQDYADEEGKDIVEPQTTEGTYSDADSLEEININDDV